MATCVGCKKREMKPWAILLDGRCADCVVRTGVFAVESVLAGAEERLDALPFGVIELDAAGVVLAYNRAEEELAGRSRDEVLGRNFFTEIAPCTNVQEFAGRYHEMVTRGGASEASLEFIFRFPEGAQLVWVQLFYSEVSQRGLILVQSRAESWASDAGP